MFPNMAPLISPSSCSSPGAVKRFTGFTTRSDWLKEGEIRGVFRARVTVMTGSSGSLNRPISPHSEEFRLEIWPVWLAEREEE